MDAKADSKQQTSPLHLLHRAEQHATDLFLAQITDVTPRQLTILVAVAEKEGANQTRIVERTGIDRSTVGNLLARLNRKGLLQIRRVKEDQRANAVRLTDEGRRVLKKATPLAKRVDDRILEGLPANERKQFIETLQRMVEALPGPPGKS